MIKNCQPWNKFIHDGFLMIYSITTSIYKMTWSFIFKFFMTSLTDENFPQLVKKQGRSQMKKDAPIIIIINRHMSNNFRAFCFKLVSIKIWKTRPLRDDQYKAICFKIIWNKNERQECTITGISKLLEHCTLLLISTQIRFGQLNWMENRKSLQCSRNRGKTKRAARRKVKFKKRIAIMKSREKVITEWFQRAKKEELEKLDICFFV